MNLSAYVGIPYATHDCRALAGLVLAAHGITLPESALEARAAGWRPVDHPKPLDIAMFKMPEGMHVGVVVSRGTFLHADRETGKSRIERYTSPEWSPKLEGFYRYAG